MPGHRPSSTALFVPAGCRRARQIPVCRDVVVRLRMCQCIARQTAQVATSVVDTHTGSGGVRQRNRVQVSAPGFEPGLSRPQRDVLTTSRCGHLVFAASPGHRHVFRTPRDVATLPRDCSAWRTASWRWLQPKNGAVHHYRAVSNTATQKPRRL